MKIPEPCEKCAPFSGYFMETPAGLKRCDCARGDYLTRASETPEPQEPVISPEYAMVCVEMLSAMAYFPSAAGARGAIADEFAGMCASNGDAKWLAMRMLRLYEKWPGVVEMRRVFCASKLPLDAVAEIGVSETYPDGFPSEQPPAKQAPLRLVAGGDSASISASPSVEQTIRDLAELKNMNRTGPAPKVHDIPVRQITEAQRITKQMVDEAEERNRAARAVQELGDLDAD